MKKANQALHPTKTGKMEKWGQVSHSNKIGKSQHKYFNAVPVSV